VQVIKKRDKQQKWNECCMMDKEAKGIFDKLRKKEKIWDSKCECE
jgi:hypothetical protein